MLSPTRLAPGCPDHVIQRLLAYKNVLPCLNADTVPLIGRWPRPATADESADRGRGGGVPGGEPAATRPGGCARCGWTQRRGDLVSATTPTPGSHWEVSPSDGSIINAGGPCIGPRAPKGETGAQGVGISEVSCDSTTTTDFTVTLTDVRTLTFSCGGTTPSPSPSPPGDTDGRLLIGSP
jgi:hypothetical protein